MRTLPGLENTIIVVELEGFLNYLHRGQAHLREAIQQLEELLWPKELPAFLDGLGIVGLPYSQSNALFLNCLLYHELGHYVYGKLGLQESANRLLEPPIIRVFPSLGRSDCNYLTEKLHPWCEEIFCDLFAVRMIGPMYTFVYADLLGLLGALDPKDIPLFSPTHPSDSVRIREQLNLLKSTKWWDYLTQKQVPELSRMEPIAYTELPAQPCRDDSVLERLPQLVNIFEEIMPGLRSLAEDVVGDRGAAREEFCQEYDDIHACLAHGLVPSTVVPSDRPVFDHHLVALLNSAFFFDFGAIDQLFEMAEGKQPDSVADQAFLRRRVEEWTLKAAEDLVSQYYGQENPTYGSSKR